MKKRTIEFLKKYPRGIIAVIAVGVILCASFLISMNTHTDRSLINSNETLPFMARVISPQGVYIQVKVADTDKTRELGLSHTASLGKKEGMLFVFPQVGVYSFWMKDMNFPIDIIWVDENLKIVDRSLFVSPSSYPKTFIPQSPVKYVLELPTGVSNDYGFIVGSFISIDQNK